jgi:integrase/recombinase XerD
MAKDLLAVEKRSLTTAQFGALAEVPPELEWLANITNAHTRRAYKNDVDEFVAFSGLRSFGELRGIIRAHVIAWRKDLESRHLSPATIRRKLSAQSALFDYLCESNAVAGNPVDGVKRPMANGNEGLTPALGDAQARKLIEAPKADTLKGVRDRAILATLLYHGRREELCGLRVRDMQSRQGVMRFRIKGKRDKIRFVPMHPMAQRLIEEYLALAGHAADATGPVFRPVTNNRTGELDKPLDGRSVYDNIVRKYARETGVSAKIEGLCVHSLRATAATNALENAPDIAKVQEWLGHANIATTGTTAAFYARATNDMHALSLLRAEESSLDTEVDTTAMSTEIVRNVKKGYSIASAANRKE